MPLNLSQLLGDVQPTTIAFVVAAAFFSAIFHSVSGFAGGLILSVALVPILGVKAVVPVMAVSLLISHTSRTFAYRKGFNWPIYRDVMRTALPCMVIGALVYAYLPARWIALLLGIFLIATVPMRQVLKAKNVTPGRRALGAVGVPFGLLSGSTIGAGMILAPFMIASGLTGETLMGTMAALAWTVNLTKAGVFAMTSVLDSTLLALGVVIGLCTVPGNFVGRWIVRHTPVRVHIAVVEAVVVTGGLYFLYEAALGFGLAR